MKNKKGFTLIELIACIGLMAMLSTIIITVSVKRINETKQKSRETMIESIELAAINYINENLSILTEFRKNDYMYITLQTLVENNKLSSNLKDRTTDKVLPLTDTVYVTRSYNSSIDAIYDIEQNTKPKIALTGSYNIYLDKNETYNELGATATSSNGADVTSNLTITETVNTSVSGLYKVLYTVDGATVSRNVIVDKTSEGGGQLSG